MLFTFVGVHVFALISGHTVTTAAVANTIDGVLADFVEELNGRVESKFHEVDVLFKIVHIVAHSSMRQQRAHQVRANYGEGVVDIIDQAQGDAADFFLNKLVLMHTIN